LSYQWRLTRLLWLILAAVLGLVLALAIAGGSQLGGFAGHSVLAGGATRGGPSPPPHPNVQRTGAERAATIQRARLPHLELVHTPGRLVVSAVT